MTKEPRAYSFKLHFFNARALVAKLVDAQDLKSWATLTRACRFNSGPGHQIHLNLFDYRTNQVSDLKNYLPDEELVLFFLYVGHARNLQ